MLHLRAHCWQHCAPKVRRRRKSAASRRAGLLAAIAGARVVKHGNRSVSSQSGSADVLESLGMPLPLDEQAAIDCLAALNFTFLFAPAYHPAMKSIMPVRGALGVRTVFNMLGPLTNPSAPPHQLVGAWSNEAAGLMADTLSGMPIERAFVVHGEPGWDEASPAGDFILYDVRPGSVERSVRTPEDYGVSRCSPEDLRGGDAAHNAAELARVLRGEDQGPHHDAILMGASLILEVTGLASDHASGFEMAAAAIDSGRGAAFLEAMHKHFARCTNILRPDGKLPQRNGARERGTGRSIEEPIRIGRARSAGISIAIAGIRPDRGNQGPFACRGLACE
jgi:anthranilate phosphoribosyltransferase